MAKMRVYELAREFETTSEGVILKDEPEDIRKAWKHTKAVLAGFKQTCDTAGIKVLLADEIKECLMGVDGATHKFPCLDYSAILKFHPLCLAIVHYDSFYGLAGQHPAPIFGYELR